MKIEDNLLSEKKRKIICAVIMIAAFIALAVVTAVVWRDMIAFVSNPEALRGWVDSRGVWGRLVFVGMVMFQVVLAVIPGEPLEIAAGFAFGAFEGTLLCILGTLLGGAIVFLLVRTLGIKMVSVFFSVEKIRSMRFLQNTKRVKIIAFLLFFLPGTPKDLLSYFAGLLDIGWGYWLFLTSVVRLPSIITSTVGGDALGVKNYFFAVVVFGVALVLSLIGYWIYNRYSKRGSI